MKKNSIGIKIIGSILLTCSLIVSIFILYPNNAKGFLQNTSGTIYGFWQGIFWGNRITLLPGQSASPEIPMRCTNGNANLRQDRGGVWVCFQYAIVISPVPPPPPPPPPPPNQPPTVRYTGTTSVGYTTATANWSYSDPEGDTQTISQVQIATDSGFSNIIANPSQSGSVTTLSISTLRAGTTYYPRVRAHNNVNGWTGWVSGPAFTTAQYPQAEITFDVQDIDGGQTLDGDRLRFSWDVSSSIGVQSCTASTTGGTVNGNTIWQGNRSTTGRSEGNLAFSQIARNYDFTLSCTPRPGGRSINSVTRRISHGSRPGNVSLSIRPVGTTRPITDLRQGDGLEITQTVTRPEVFTACNKTISGPTTAPSSGTYFLGNTSKADGVFGATIDQSLRFRTDYQFTSICEPLDGDIRRSEVTATANPKPIISCSLNNTVVSERNNMVRTNLVGDSSLPAWPGPYQWTIKRGIGADIIRSNSTLNVIESLDYTDAVMLGLGKYQVRAILSAGGAVSDEIVCGTVTSLGNRTIREISP